MLRGRIRGSARKLAVFLIGIALLTTSAAAADIKLVSLRFSVERPVPHLRLDGPIVAGDADRLEKAIEKYTSCAGSCKTGYAGSSRAVVSLSGQRGSLEEGLRAASVLKSNLIVACLHLLRTPPNDGTQMKSKLYPRVALENGAVQSVRVL